MRKPIKIAGDCPDNKTCPATWDTGETEYVYVQGERVEDPASLGLDDIPAHELVVRFPRRLWEEGRQ